MGAYWRDGRGRYDTEDSYDNFPQYLDDKNLKVFTSSDRMWTYRMNGDGIELLRYNDRQIHIKVPSVVDGRKVNSLSYTFDGFHELKSVEIPDGVTSMVGAFFGCTGLEEAHMPDGVKDLSHAFESCFSLKDLWIPDSVTNFSYAFSEAALESIAFPQGALEIQAAFSASLCLKRAIIPKTIQKSYEAFCTCENLEYVELEEGIQALGDYMFFDCHALKELKIPKSVKKIGQQAVGIYDVLEPGVEGYGPGPVFRVAGQAPVPSFRIVGVRGTVAERYARREGIPFVEAEE